MTNVLGLPLKTALELIGSEDTQEVLIEKYTAPRVGNTRGTLRVVRVRDGGHTLTVCAFPDDVSVTEDKKA